MTIDETALTCALQTIERGGALSQRELAALSNLHPDEVERFGGVWAGLNAERRVDLLHQLSRSEAQTLRHDFNALYDRALDDDDPVVRRTALESVIEDESPRLFEKLLDLVGDDPSPPVRAAAADLLGRFVLKAEVGGLSADDSTRVETALQLVLNRADEAAAVRQSAIASLGFLDNQGVARAIQRCYADEMLRLASIRAMGRSANSRWLRILGSEASSDDPDTRLEVARACGEIADEDAVPILVELIDDPELDVRLAAIAALGEIGSDEARETLFYAAEDPNETIREAAEAALMNLDADDDSSLV